jgi:hypothetical protein
VLKLTPSSGLCCTIARRVPAEHERDNQWRHCGGDRRLNLRQQSPKKRKEESASTRIEPTYRPQTGAPPVRKLAIEETAE